MPPGSMLPIAPETLRHEHADVTLDIRNEPTPSRSALRALFAASLESFLGPASVLDAELSCPGSPILALDSTGRLTLISFDAEDGIEAFLTGLAAWQETRAGTPWLRRLYPSLCQMEAPLTPRLVVLMPALPPGFELVASDRDHLQIFCFRVLSVDGQPALLVEPANRVAHGLITAPGQVDTDPQLTVEEATFLDASFS